jgi:O-antigen/teichoic acid export membrane protein
VTEGVDPVSRRRLSVASAAYLGARVLSAALGVGVAALLSRALSGREFGQFSLALSLTTLGVTFGDLGITQIAVREMAAQPARRARVAGALSATRFVLGVVFMLAGVAVSFALMSNSSARLASVWVLATLPFSAVNVLTSVAQARLRAELVMLPVLLQSAVWLAGVAMLAAVHAPLETYGIAFFVSNALQAVCTRALTRRLTRVSFESVRPVALALMRLAWPIGLAGLFVTTYYKIDGILVYAYNGALASARYSAAYRILDVVQIFPGTVSAILLPALARSSSEAGASRARQRSVDLAAIALFAVSAPVAVCGAIDAHGILVSIYARQYANATNVLSVLLFAFVPISVGYLVTNILILEQRLKAYLVATCVGAVVNVIANVIALPSLGPIAAAWTTVGTEVLVAGCLTEYVRRSLGYSVPVGRLLRVAIAVTPAAVVTWVLRDAAIETVLAAAFAVYGLAAICSRIVTREELVAMWSRSEATQA